MVGDGFGMALDNTHCTVGGRIVVMLFLMLVLSCVLFFVIDFILNMGHEVCVIF